MKHRPAIQKLFLLIIVLCALQLPCKAQEQAVKPKGLYSSDFDIDSIPRNITFYIPAGYGKKEAYPLVFVLHAEGEAGKTVIKKYGNRIQQLADSFDCVVVYPDAVKGHWNTKMGLNAGEDTINDAAFINIMIDYFIQQYYCDRDRVFAAGFYTGGEMVWHLACAASKKISAIAPFTSTIPAEAKDCAANNKISIFDAEKSVKQPVKKIDESAISAAFIFLMAHGKN